LQTQGFAGVYLLGFFLPMGFESTHP